MASNRTRCRLNISYGVAEGEADGDASPTEGAGGASVSSLFFFAEVVCWVDDFFFSEPFDDVLAFSVLDDEVLEVVVIVSLLSLAQDAKNAAATIIAMDDRKIFFIGFGWPLPALGVEPPLTSY
jgi:hypothetical protein